MNIRQLIKQSYADAQFQLYLKQKLKISKNVVFQFCELTANNKYFSVFWNWEKEEAQCHEISANTISGI